MHGLGFYCGLRLKNNKKKKGQMWVSVQWGKRKLNPRDF